MKISVSTTLFLWKYLLIAGFQKNSFDINLSAVSSMVKVPVRFKNRLPSIENTAKISTTEGKYESFQAVVSSGDSAAVKGVRRTVSVLREEADEVRISNVIVNPVGFVQTTVASKVYHGSSGWWPNPLLRMDSSSIPAGKHQPLWAITYVSRGTPAGTCQGHIIVIGTIRQKRFRIEKLYYESSLGLYRPYNPHIFNHIKHLYSIIIASMRPFTYSKRILQGAFPKI